MKTFTVLLTLTFMPLAFAGPHWDKARELYKSGPTSADQIISELKLELVDSPENETALMLLAITQRGIGKFDDSLVTLDRLEKLNQKKEVLNPDLYMLRVENVYFKKDYKKTQELLTAYWGILQSSDRLKKKSEALSEAVQKALKEETEPNKALVPTAISVTPAADAPVAPAAAAAHL
jgi:hypothetical protein